MKLTDIDSVLRKNKIKPRGKLASISESLYDAAKELSYYDPVRRNTDLATGPVPMKKIPTAAGKVARVVKKNFIAPVMDAYQTMNKVNTGQPYSMGEAQNFAGVGLLASMLGGPKGGFDPSETAVIRQPPIVTKAIRKILKDEYKARGPVDQTNPIDILLRRTVFRGELHGRWPKVVENKAMAPNFGHKWRTASNIGEPVGVSSTFSPEVAVNSFSNSAEMSRAVPLFGDKPENVILNMLDAKHRGIVKGSYITAVNKYLDEAPDDIILKLAGSKKPWELFSLDKFNDHLTTDLEEKGYKGILYHPDRYGEQELKMFNPADLLHLDMRKLGDKAVDRYIGDVVEAKTNRDIAYQDYLSTTQQETSLRDSIYSKIDTTGVIRKHPKVQDVIRKELESLPKDIRESVTDIAVFPLAKLVYNQASKPGSTTLNDIYSEIMRLPYDTLLDAAPQLADIAIRHNTAFSNKQKDIALEMASMHRDNPSVMLSKILKYTDFASQKRSSMGMELLRDADELPPAAVDDIMRVVTNKLGDNTVYTPLGAMNSSNAETIKSIFKSVATSDKLSDDAIQYLSELNSAIPGFVDTVYPKNRIATLVGRKYANAVFPLKAGTTFDDIVKSGALIKKYPNGSFAINIPYYRYLRNVMPERAHAVWRLLKEQNQQIK